LTWLQLLQSLTHPQQELARQALTKLPAKATVVVAIPDDVDSPVAPVSELPLLTISPQLLQRMIRHPKHGCSADTPVQPLIELVKSLDKRLQKLVMAAWSELGPTTPAGIATIRNTKGKKTQVSFHDTRFPRPETLLAERLLVALRQTTADHSRPFTTLADLLTLAGIETDHKALPAALALPEIQTAFCTLRGRGSEAWIAHADRLTDTLSRPLLLSALLAETCSASSPEIRLSALAKLLSKDIQPSFTAAWLQPAAADALKTVCHVTPAGTPRKPDLLLRDLRFPSPEKITSEKLVQALLQAKTDGGTQYPLRWSALQQLAAPDVPRDILHKATLAEPFVAKVTIACPNAPDSPVFLTADLESSVRSAAMLSFLVRRATAEDNVALPPQKLSAAAGLNPTIKPLLNTVADELIAGAALPPGIGLARIARKWQLLDLSRIRAGANLHTTAAPTPAAMAVPAAAANPEAFAAAFDLAFTRLSQTSHLPGYVSLADLRPALSEYPREVFDSQLLLLRRAGRYSLSLLEGRMALSAEEESAVILLDNRPYLLVQQR
ncbi:MAG: hypothetical protein ACKOEO_05555, partial [Planctomycetaceae bacterium]